MTVPHPVLGPLPVFLTFGAAAPRPSPPSSSAWPDATNTGPVGPLTQVPAQATSGTGWHWDASNSSIRIDTAGAQLASLDVSGGVLNNPSTGNPFNATDCIFRMTGWADASVGVQLVPGCNMLRCTFGGGPDGTTYVRSLLLSAYGSVALPITIKACNIGYGTHGIHCGGSLTVTDSWIHQMNMGLPYNGGSTPNPNDHTDCVFLDHGNGTTFQHCRFSGGNQAGFFGQNYTNSADGSGPMSFDRCKFETDLTNQGQPFGGPPNYGLDIENKAIRGAISVTNSVFDRGPWGQGFGAVPDPATIAYPVTLSGNTYSDNGASCDANFVLNPFVY